MRIICIMATCVILSACAKDAPPPLFITSDPPQLPDTCDTSKVPSPKEPRLPDQDITDVIALKDREAWKKNARVERSHRQSCSEQLKALFPSKEREKPTS
jgi:hypothetical protein